MLPVLKSVEEGSGRRSIEIYVFHSIEGDDPNGPMQGDPPDEGEAPGHFDAFYDLFDRPASRRLPRYKDLPDIMERLNSLSEKRRGGSPVTCMVASATVE